MPPYEPPFTMSEAVPVLVPAEIVPEPDGPERYVIVVVVPPVMVPTDGVPPDASTSTAPALPGMLTAEVPLFTETLAEEEAANKSESNRTANALLGRDPDCINEVVQPAALNADEQLEEVVCAIF
jgi:hypothetical protein